MIVLANMIKSNKLRRRLSKELKTYNFIGKKHRTIFNVLNRFTEKNLEFDFDTFVSLTKEDEEYGSLVYLQKIEKLFEENCNIDYHINILKTDSIKHHIKEKRLEKLIDVLEDPHSDIEKVNDQINFIKKEITDNFDKTYLISGSDLRKEWWKDYQNRKKETIYVPTGISGLDFRLIEGLARKKCSVWAARPGMGKTTTMANIGLNLIRGIKDDKGEIVCPPKKVLIVPLETGHISYIDIMVTMIVKEKMQIDLKQGISALSGITLEKMIRYADQITKDEEKYIKIALDEIFANPNLVVSDNPSMSLNQLEITLENENFDICIIDLWEKLSDVRIEASVIAEKLNRTQAMAKDYNVHMAIVQQIKRNKDEKGKAKKPSIELLKNSGGYEEIADLVIMMHREKYYDPSLQDDVIEYIIGKQRRGVMNKSAYHLFESRFGIIGPRISNYNKAEKEEIF
jgi:replicative DNA helicase